MSPVPTNNVYELLTYNKIMNMVVYSLNMKFRLHFNLKYQ